MREIRGIKAGIRRRLFTLVELLIVIGVISILAALLLPALAAAKDSAYTAICQSNLKQLGLWAMMYANDWEGVLPHDGYGDNSGHGYKENSDNIPWMNRCELYTKFKAQGKCNPVLQCPKARKVLTPMEYPWRIDYGLSDPIRRNPDNVNRPPGLPRLTTVKPSSIMFGPCTLGGLGGWWDGKVNTDIGCNQNNWIWGINFFSFSKGHSGGSGANFYHIDGSVRTRLLNDYKTEALEVKTAHGNAYYAEDVYLWGMRRDDVP